jgi:hypothetical protein
MLPVGSLGVKRSAPGLHAAAAVEDLILVSG